MAEGKDEEMEEEEISTGGDDLLHSFSGSRGVRRTTLATDNRRRSTTPIGTSGRVYNSLPPSIQQKRKTAPSPDVEQVPRILSGGAGDTEIPRYIPGVATPKRPRIQENEPAMSQSPTNLRQPIAPKNALGLTPVADLFATAQAMAQTEVTSLLEELNRSNCEHNRKVARDIASSCARGPANIFFIEPHKDVSAVVLPDGCQCLATVEEKAIELFTENFPWTNRLKSIIIVSLEAPKLTPEKVVEQLRRAADNSHDTKVDIQVWDNKSIKISGALYAQRLYRMFNHPDADRRLSTVKRSNPYNHHAAVWNNTTVKNKTLKEKEKEDFDLYPWNCLASQVLPNLDLQSLRASAPNDFLSLPRFQPLTNEMRKALCFVLCGQRGSYTRPHRDKWAKTWVQILAGMKLWEDDSKKWIPLTVGMTLVMLKGNEHAVSGLTDTIQIGGFLTDICQIGEQLRHQKDIWDNPDSTNEQIPNDAAKFLLTIQKMKNEWNEQGLPCHYEESDWIGVKRVLEERIVCPCEEGTDCAASMECSCMNEREDKERGCTALCSCKSQCM